MLSEEAVVDDAVDVEQVQHWVGILTVSRDEQN
jgi:hypothetical protein